MNTIHHVHWNQQECEALVKPMRQAGRDARIESEGGVWAYTQITEDPPDALAISLARLPSHGRQTALAVRQRIPLEALPIFLVDGDPARIELVQEKLPGAQFLPSEELVPTLAKIKDRVYP
ncbi:MAG: hypothetical protein ACLFWD_03295 [Anaerolineales bacterium]